MKEYQIISATSIRSQEAMNTLAAQGYVFVGCTTDRIIMERDKK